MPVEEILALDISDALAEVDRLEARLTTAVGGIGGLLGESLAGVDVDGLAGDLGAAADLFAEQLAAASGALDVGGLAGDLGAAADLFGEELAAAVGQAAGGIGVPVSADIDEEALRQQAEAALADPFQATVEATIETPTAAVLPTGETQDYSAAVTGLGAAAGAATGDLSGLTAAAQGAGGPLAAAAGAAAAFAVAGGALASQAIDARSAQETFNLVVGEFGAQVQQIDVAGLNVDLGVLANQLGGSDEAAQLAAARIFQLATAAGQAGPQAAQLTDQILALSANAVALNPGLGDLGGVAEGLTTALARGGRFAANYGLSLNAAEIEARALADTGKSTAAELTLVERSTAGAALALEQLGPGGVAGNVAAGIDNVRAQFGAVREEIGNLLEAAGGPILDPLLGVIRTGVPLVGSLAEVFGELLAGALPLAEVLVESLVPAMEGLVPVAQLGAGVLGVLADVLDAIPEPLLAAASAAVLLNSGLGPLPNTFSKIAAAMAAQAGAAGKLGAAWTGLTTGAGGIATTVGLAATALGLYQQQVAKAERMAADLGVQIRETFAGQVASGAVTSVDDFNRVIAETERQYNDLVDTANGSQAPWDADKKRQIREGAQELLAFRSELIAQRDALTVLGEQTGVNAEQFAGFVGTQEELAQKIRDTVAETDGLTAAQAAYVAGAPNLDDAIAIFADGVPTVADFAEAMRITGLDAATLTTLLGETRAAVGVLADELTSKLPTIQQAFDQLAEGEGLQAFLDRIVQQATDTAAFTVNIATLISRGATDLATSLLELGPAAAGIAAEAAAASEPALALYESQVDAVNSRNAEILAADQAFAQILVDGTVTTAERVALAFDLSQIPENYRVAIVATATTYGADSPEVRALAAEAGLSGEATSQALNQGLIDGFAVSSGDPVELGGGWVGGIIAGINARRPEAVQAASAVGSSVAAAVAAIWQSASPSKVAQDLGAGFSQGLALGVKSGTAQVATAAGDLADAALLVLQAIDFDPDALAVGLARQQAGIEGLEDAWSQAAPTGAEFAAAMSTLGLTAEQTQELLGQVTDETRRFVDEVARGFSSVPDVLSDVLRDDDATLADFTGALADREREQAAFLERIAALQAAGADDLARALLQAGPEAAAALAAEASGLTAGALAAIEGQVEAAGGLFGGQLDTAGALATDAAFTLTQSFTPDLAGQAKTAMGAAAAVLGDPAALVAAAQASAAAVSAAFTVAPVPAATGGTAPAGAITSTAGGTTVVIERLEVVAPAGASADELGKAIAAQLAWSLR